MHTSWTQIRESKSVVALQGHVAHVTQWVEQQRDGRCQRTVPESTKHLSKAARGPAKYEIRSKIRS
eukprot:scaffold173040_cov16-Tisochrysis_lutea.AAC.1